MIEIKKTDNILTFANKWDHFKARWGINRMGHRADPGLYAIGNPNPNSPVFVTANYTLSFDALRSSLIGINGYILVLDTNGINVWCAAGKGTFGTDELVQKIHQTHLEKIVNHRTLILPQLGAPGIAAHNVKKRTGFSVEYGPIRSADLPEYLKTKKATSSMRTVKFTLKDRLILIPVELMRVFWYTLAISIAVFFLNGVGSVLSIIVVVLTGTVLFPILLPWLPSSDFTSKGLILSGFIVIPFIVSLFTDSRHFGPLLILGYSIANYLQMAPWVGFLALNFTGSTTFTSRSGVRREIFTYIPWLAVMFITGIMLTIVLKFGRLTGWFT